MNVRKEYAKREKSAKIGTFLKNLEQLEYKENDLVVPEKRNKKCQPVKGKFGRRDVCVKIQKDWSAEEVIEHIEILIQLENHVNLIRYYTTRIDHSLNAVKFVYEKCQSSLVQWNERNKCTYSSLQNPKGHYGNNLHRLDIVLQLTRGLDYIHSQRIVHLRMRPSNILINETQGNVCVKIHNFGIAKKTDGPCQLAREIIKKYAAWFPFEVFEVFERKPKQDVPAVNIIVNRNNFS